MRLGRQSADHLGLEPGMLWVRVPPELLKQSVLVEQPGVLACLSRRRSRVQIPSGTLDRMIGTVRKPAKRRSSNLGDCGFDSRPCHLKTYRVGWALACPSGCNPPALGIAGSTPPPNGCALEIRPVRLSVQDGGPSSRKGGFDSRTGHLEVQQLTTKWWNWQTRDAQNVVPTRAWEFDSPLGHSKV